MAIVTSRYWVKNSQINRVEDNSTEFKNHRSISDEEVKKDNIKISPVSNAICGFLNQGIGGVIFLGIHDSGRIDGMHLTPSQMDHVYASVANTLSRFNPAVPQGAVKVRFVPVLPEDHANPRDFMEATREKVKELRQVTKQEEKKHQLRRPIGRCWCDIESQNMADNGEIIPDWIVEIKIEPSEGVQLPVSDKMSDIPRLTCFLQYENEQQIAFLRVDAATRKMFPFDTSRHVNEAAIKHYQPIINRLKDDINDGLNRLGIKDLLEPSDIDEHRGMRREAGTVIQPNVVRPLS